MIRTFDDTGRFDIGSNVLFALMRQIGPGGSDRPNPDDVGPIGPWGPVIRTALSRVTAFGPWPEPWRIALARFLAMYPGASDAIDPQYRDFDAVGLNPQPLPPRQLFLKSIAAQVVERAELLQDIAGMLTDEGSERGIIIVSGYVGRFVDDWCPTPPRWPPGLPRPKWWLYADFSGLDLLILAEQFNLAAQETVSPALAQVFGRASARFGETGAGLMA